MIRILLLSLLFIGLISCKDEKSEQATTIDLSSAEATGATILTALKNDDKETFQKCLSLRLQKKAKECEGQETDNCKKRHSLDAMFKVWKNNAEKHSITPETFNKYDSLKEYDGEWRLNDS